jgi:hypothetical protein
MPAMVAEERVYALRLALEAADAQRTVAPFRYTFCTLRFHADAGVDPATDTTARPALRH